MDELWRDLNNKWSLFTQTRGVLREVVGHFVAAMNSTDIWGM